MNSLMFIVFLLFGLHFGRMIGRFISRTLLYKINIILTIILCILWGFVIAFILGWGIISWHPNIILIILSYGAGAYVSVPNYGLLDVNSIPNDKLRRHYTIYLLPLMVYILFSLIFALSLT